MKNNTAVLLGLMNVGNDDFNAVERFFAPAVIQRLGAVFRPALSDHIASIVDDFARDFCLDRQVESESLNHMWKAHVLHHVARCEPSRTPMTTYSHLSAMEWTQEKVQKKLKEDRGDGLPPRVCFNPI